jgi:hypothetical protein
MPLFRVGFRLVAVLTSLQCYLPAIGALIVTNNESLWDARCSYDALRVTAEDFERFDGSFPYLSGSLVDTAWSISSATGISAASGRVSSPLSPMFTINLASPVNGIAGQWGAIDSVGNAQVVIVTAVTVDGNRYDSLLIGAGFAGFVSRSREIASIEVFAAMSQEHTPFIDSLRVAIPTPSAFALLALVGFATRRRRG